jgi:ribosome-associated protein
MKKSLPPESEIHLSFARSSGPGGQNVNKVNSKVILHWDMTASQFLTELQKNRFLTKFKNQLNDEGVLQLSSQTMRTQKQNTEEVLNKLKHMIEAVRKVPKARVKTKPSKSQNEKRLKSKKLESLKKRLRKNYD